MEIAFIGINVRRSRVLQSIQQKIVRNFYQITEHALDEMRKDMLSTVDVKHRNSERSGS